MSKITNINNAPMVSPKEATILALKNGKMARCDFSKIINIVEKVQNMSIDELKANFETIKNNFGNIETYLKALDNKMQTAEKRITELEKAINSILSSTQNEEAVMELVEETTKSTKTSRKSKKTAESAE